MKRWTVGSFYRKVYLPTYLIGRNASGRTIETYSCSVRHWCRMVGDTTLARLGDRMQASIVIGELITKLAERPGLIEDHVCPTTINCHLRHIRAVLNRAHRLGLMASKVEIELLRTPTKIPRYIPERDINAIYRACKVAIWPKCVRASDWWRALLVLAWNTGLRKRTLLALPRSSVLATSELLITHNIVKNRHEQLIPMNECVVRHIKRLIRQHDHERVMPWAHSRKIFYEQWHDIQSAAGITRHQHYKLHDLRRTCATEMRKHGSADAAQGMLGHSSFRMTAQYICWPEIMRAVVDRIPQPRAFRA